MAATKYTYSISTDFPDDAVASDKLTDEIEESSITTSLSFIETAGDSCDIWFADTLSSGDETTLDGLVAVHDGIPQKVEKVNLQLTLPKEVVGSATKALVNDRPAITLPTNQDSAGAIALTWPLDLNSNVELRLVATFIVAPSGSGASVEMIAKVKAESEGEDSGAVFSITDSETVAVNHTNPGDTFCATLVLGVPSFDRGDSVALQIGRKGTDVADVVDVSIHLVALEGAIYL